MTTDENSRIRLTDDEGTFPVRDGYWADLAVSRFPPVGISACDQCRQEVPVLSVILPKYLDLPRLQIPPWISVATSTN